MSKDRRIKEKKGFKVVLVGDKYAGKTSLAKRYFRNRFDPGEVATIGASYLNKTWSVYGKDYEMGVWDTSGEERYRSIVNMYYRDAVAAIICFDLTEPVTYENLDYWAKTVLNIEPLCKLYFCATKCDLINVADAYASLSVAQNVACENSAKFYVTSSKTGGDVANLFEAIFEDYLSDAANRQKKTETIKLPSGHVQWSRRKRKCCANN